MKWREIMERRGVKPLKPLSPAAARREADRKSNISKRITDLSDQHAKKIIDLRAKLASRP
jgi:hypothetical protein